MTQSMIERVARALAENQCGRGAPPDDNDRSMARAAIEAMRVPTEAMVNAGYDVGYSPDPLPTDLVWTAMVDAALKEQVKE